MTADKVDALVECERATAIISDLLQDQPELVQTASGLNNLVIANVTQLRRSLRDKTVATLAATPFKPNESEIQTQLRRINSSLAVLGPQNPEV